MVIVNAPLRADLFREKAESLGLVYVSKVGSASMLPTAMTRRRLLS